MCCSSDISISVIVPVYNSEKYLSECLDSIVNQTIFEQLEIIIINDGSTDNSQSIIDRYNKKYSNVHSIIQKNKGITKTRSVGLQNAKGEYIGWVDSDDIIELNMFEKMYSIAKANDADFISCDYDMFPEEVKLKSHWYKQYQGTVDWQFVERNTQQWNKLVKRELLDRVNMSYWMEYCGEGAYAFAIIAATKIITLKDCLYHYRVGHLSLSSNMKNSQWYINNVTKVKRQYEGIIALGFGDKWSEYFNYRIIYAVIMVLIVSSSLSEKRIYLKYKKELEDSKYKKNIYLKIILDNNFGKIKSLVLRFVIPKNYLVSHIISKIAL